MPLRWTGWSFVTSARPQSLGTTISVVLPNLASTTPTLEPTMLHIPSDLADCPTTAQKWLVSLADDPSVSDAEYATAATAVNVAILGDEFEAIPAPVAALA